MATIRLTVNAEAGQAPAHVKSRTPNGDGTYKLELNVTGESENDPIANKANVVIVVDLSGSMNWVTSGSGNRSEAGWNQIGRYGRQGDGDYRRLYYAYQGRYYPEGTGPQSTTRHTTVYIRDAYNNGTYYWNDYNGTRYNYANNNNSRLEETIVGVKSLIDTLLAQNNGRYDDMIELSLVSFSTRAQYVSPTSASANGWTKGTDGTALKNAVDTMYAVGATNWDESLYYAKALADAKNDGDKTFIVFFSDGEPTQHNGTASSPTNHSHNNNTSGGGSSTQEADINSAYYEGHRFYGDTADLYGIFAYGSEDGREYMQYLTSYSNYNDFNHTSTTAGNTNFNEYYFAADNQEQINEAFNQIATSIANAVGINDVSIDDGTTNQVTTTSGEVSELLEVDENSYEYWMSWQMPTGSNKITMFIDGAEKEYTVTANGDNVVITWDGGSATYPGTISGNLVKIKWGDTTTKNKTPFYNYEPADAALDAGGHVKWDLDNVGTLLNGVTYSVTFDVYPSQETYDLIADLKNGKKTYADLDANIKNYLLNPSEGVYTLKTNTNASITYSDSRPGGKTNETVAYNTLDEVGVVAEQLNVVKEWHGTYYGEESTEKFTMEVLQNGSHYVDVELTYNGSDKHEGTAYISTGLMRVNKTAGTVQVLDSGYDYKLVEPADLSYHWELTADTLHPMLINGVLTVLKEDTAPTGMGTREYYSDGTYEYYKINGKVYSNHTDAAALKATNIRRSNLNLTKKVTGNDAPADTYFTFKMNVKNPGNATENLYFSVWNGGYVVDREIPEEQWADNTTLIAEKGFTVTGEGLRLETNSDEKYTGFYVVAPGTEVTVKLKKDWNLRFTNVLTGTTYTFEEVTPLATGYTFVSAAASAVVSGSNPAESVTVDPIASALKTEGVVNVGNADYTVTYTNQYNPVKKAPSLTKKVEGWNAISDFEFSIEPADDTTRTAVSEGHVIMPNPATVSTGTGMLKDQEKTVKFGEIEFTRPGTYVFKIDETTTTSAAGWTYDDATHNVTITVTENADTHVLEAAIDGDNPTFTNTYHADPTTAIIPVRKDVTPGEGLAIPDIAGKFTFTLRPRNGAPKVGS